MEILKNIFLIWFVVFFGIIFLGILAGLILYPKVTLKQMWLMGEKLLRWLYYRIIFFQFIRSYQEILHNWKHSRRRQRNGGLSKHPSTVTRAVWVLIVSIMTVGFGYFILDCLGQPNGCAGLSALKIDKMDIKVVSTAAVLLITSPIFFLVWLYRDVNKLKEIEQQRKDTNLKEFQKLQEWATGNISGYFYEETDGKKTIQKVKDEAIALQISALHSLRAYLKGEYGESFKRGAFEIFASVLKTQHKKIIDILDPRGLDNFLTSKEISDEINQDELTKQINRIVSEDWFSFFLDHDFSMHSLSLVGISFPSKDFSSKTFGRPISLGSCDFRGASLFGWFQGINFSNSDFRGANLHGDFTGCSFSSSNLSGAFLASSKFKGSNFERAILQGVYARRSDFQGANFSKADLRGSDLQDTNFQTAIFDDANLIGVNLNNAKLQASYLINTKLFASNFDGANFDGVVSKDFKDRIWRESFEKVIMNSIGKKADLSGASMEISSKEAVVLESVLRRVKDDIWSKGHSHIYNNWIERAISIVKEPVFIDLNKLDGTYSQEEAKAWLKKYREVM